MATEDNESLRVGHDSAGDDCTSKVFEFGKKGTFAGNYIHLLSLNCNVLIQWLFCPFDLLGGFFGAVEACFLPGVPVGQPVFMKALTLTLGRCMLGGMCGKSNLLLYNLHIIVCKTGFAGGLFAGSACLSAAIRDEDDYKNAAVGGAIAGSLFGATSQSTTDVVYSFYSIVIFWPPTYCVCYLT